MRTNNGAERPLILVVASTFPANPDDGTPAFIRDLSMQLASQFDVIVLTPAVPGGSAVDEIDNVRIVRFRFFPRRWEDLADGAMLENVRSRPSRLIQVPFLLVAEAWALASLVRRTKPAALHVHWLIPQGLVSLVAARSVPRVLTTLGGDLYALESPVFRWIKRKVVRSADAVTVMNRDMAERVIGLGAEPGDVHVLPMGAEIAGAEAARGVVDTVPSQLVFAGRLVEKKGAAVFLDALRMLAGSVEISAVIIGDGPLRADLEQSAEGLPVRFTGQVSRREMLEIFASSEAAVFPSVRSSTGDQDGLPVAMLEAMAAGTAVIGSNLPGINEVVSHGETGWLSPPGDAAALADAIRALAEDPIRRDRISQAGQELVRSQYSVEAVGNAYRELFLHIIGHGPAMHGVAGAD